MSVKITFDKCPVGMVAVLPDEQFRSFDRVDKRYGRKPVYTDRTGEIPGEWICLSQMHGNKIKRIN